MNNAAYLVVWLAGLFGLLGIVLTGLFRLARRDTTAHDRRFLWHIYHLPEPKDTEDGESVEPNKNSDGDRS